MQLWTNILTAWIALILTFFLIIIWGLRLICKNKKPRLLYVINRWLRKHHKLTGLVLILSGLVHGLFSSDALFSLNWGTATWAISVLLGLNWMLRKKLNTKKPWMIYHRVLTVIFTVLLIVHILNVGGFILDDMISGEIQAPVQTQQIEQTESSSDSTASAAPSSTEDATSDTTSNTTSDAAAATETASTAESETPVYVDGVYEGVGTGFRPGLVVEVVIEDGQIASVTVVEHNEQNEKYWGTPVEEIPDAIVDAQSTDVDSISGATKTSEGIKEAVEDALSQALAS